MNEQSVVGWLDVGERTLQRGIKFHCTIHSLRERPVDVDSVTQDIKATATTLEVTPTSREAIKIHPSFTSTVHLPDRCPGDSDVSILSFDYPDVLWWGGASVWARKAVVSKWTFNCRRRLHWCSKRWLSRVSTELRFRVQRFINNRVWHVADSTGNGTGTDCARCHRCWALSVLLSTRLSTSGGGTKQARMTKVVGVAITACCHVTSINSLRLGTQLADARWAQFRTVGDVSDDTTGVAACDALSVFCPGEITLAAGVE